MNKEIFKREDIEKEIEEAIDTVAKPVVQTLSPKGSTVLIENESGSLTSTKDGFTIAKSIEVENRLQNGIIQVLKSASFKTNTEAGDGTTSTMVLSSLLAKEGLRLLGNGYNPKELTRKLEVFGDNYIKTIKKHAIKIKNDNDLYNVARISANNDDEIATDIVRTVKVVGEDGMVFIHENRASVETEIEEDLGFKVNGGIIYKELLLDSSVPSVTYNNVPVLITDKKLYYKEEARTILKAVKDAGHNSVVIVARDFMGDCISTFVANHNEGGIKVCLVKDSYISEDDATTLQDLAVYLGGKVISERSGTIVNKLKASDFAIAKKVYSDVQKTLITSTLVKNKELDNRVIELKKLSKKDSEDNTLKQRISALTNGIVTLKVGGATPLEINEKIYRYEDALNATRASLKDGYLVGGGITLLKSFNDNMTDSDLVPLFRKYSEAIIRQIAENCEKNGSEMISEVLSKKGNYGYNALTDTYEDLLKAGVIEPVKVIEMAVRNSISVANVLINTNYYVINKIDKDDK